jgi:putative DNA primase/helicase
MKISLEEATAPRRRPKGGWNNEFDVQRARSLLTLVKEIQFDPEGEKRCFNWLYRLGLDIETSMGRIKKRWPDLDDDTRDSIRNRMIAFYCAQPKKAGADSAGPDAEVFDDGPPTKTKEFANLPIHVERGTDITPKALEWLWPERIPLGKTTLLAGFPDQGKSQVMLKIAATISNGGEWPDGSGAAEKGVAIIVSSEDEGNDTIIPRFMAAGGNRENILVVKSIVREKVEGKRKVRVFNIDDDLKHVSSVIRTEAKNGRIVRMVGFDPFNAYFGGPLKADSHKSADMRALLTPIAEWAGRMKIAAVGIMHFNKGGNGHALYRITDSLAISASARAAWFCVQDPDSADHLMIQGKKNLSKGIAGLTYTIEDREIGEAGIRAPYVSWGGPTTKTADDALTIKRHREPEGVNTAMRFLQQELAHGPATKEQLEEARKAASVSEMTWRRARETIGVVSIRPAKVGGPWTFRLPEPGDDFDFEETDDAPADDAEDDGATVPDFG